MIRRARDGRADACVTSNAALGPSPTSPLLTLITADARPPVREHLGAAVSRISAWVQPSWPRNPWEACAERCRVAAVDDVHTRRAPRSCMAADNPAQLPPITTAHRTCHSAYGIVPEASRYARAKSRTVVIPNETESSSF
jgi:hypothetical protein